MRSETIHLVTPFPPDNKDGGGYVTRKLINILFGACSVRMDTRSNIAILKIMNSLIGIVLFPFLHPIFTRYVVVPKADIVVYNFSQTFSSVLVGRSDSVFIVHDLQLHREHFFKRWAVWSERFLLKRASKIYVLNKRDFDILVMDYGIDESRVFNLFPLIVDDIKSFSMLIPKYKKICFLGSLDRNENFIGVQWLVNEIVDHLDHAVDVIGSSSKFIYHPKLNYIGYVDNIDETLKNYDLMLAPMFTSQGIKIKVIDALKVGLPVLGTRDAFSGFLDTSTFLMSNDPGFWIQHINNECFFLYDKELQV